MGLFLLTILNPTSVLTHLAEITTLPGDALMLAETSLTQGGQKYASQELAQGLRLFWLDIPTAFSAPRQLPKLLKT